jgi:DNA-binding IclR family transcriptional regulator
VSPDGKPTKTGLATLNSIKAGALSPREIADATGQPLFRVRSGLRELVNAGFVELSEDKHKLTDEGEKILL